MEEVGKLTIIFGVFLIIFGFVSWFLGKLPFVGKLPGDILIKRGNFSFYAPITTTFLISLLLSIILTFIASLKK